jgi:thymidylate synthase (FAD)
MAVTAAQKQEIQTIQNETQPTRRAVAPALEEILYEPLPVLDHGFIRVVDYMGDDAAIVQAARVSYGKGTKQTNEDKGLINYLMRHRHTSPFEMCELKLHVKMPIFVARQWIRHRMASVNEYSARYSILDKEFYIPSPQHLAAQSGINRQGRDELITGAQADRILSMLKEDAATSYEHYLEMLNLDEEGNPLDASKPGLARELARMNLPVNFYTQWYWKIDLHNLMHFLKLRADWHAQYEIRAYAEVLLDIVRRWVPHTYDALMDYRVGAVEFSAKGLSAVKRMLAGENLTQETSGMSKGEWRELCTALGREAA